MTELLPSSRTCRWWTTTATASCTEDVARADFEAMLTEADTRRRSARACSTR